MTSDFYSWGEAIPASRIHEFEAHPFVVAAKRHKDSTVVELRCSGSSLGVVIDLSTELPQRPAADIRDPERICVVFHEDASRAPDVLALRKDFPSGLSHLNLTGIDEPLSLCLFEQSYRDLRYTLTPTQFLLRIFSWFTRAALEQGHLPDQLLEPFLFGDGKVIYNPRIFDTLPETKLFGIAGLGDAQDRCYKLVDLSICNQRYPQNGYLAIAVSGKPWHARTINHRPDTLAELVDLLKSVDIDLLDVLRTNIRQLQARADYNAILMQYRWLLLLRLPKTRTADGPVESFENFTFAILEQIGPLGQKLGVLEKYEDRWIIVLNPSDIEPALHGVRIFIFNPVSTLTPLLAKSLAGHSIDTDKHFVTIGSGAIGSQVIMNLARQGFAHWRIVDEDILLPHNCARHALSASYIARPKAAALASEICILFDDQTVAVPFERDILTLKKEHSDYTKIFDHADHIFDFSVSPAVSHYISSLVENVQKTSAFMLSNGKYLVVLSEGSDRSVSLADLDAQYPLAALSTGCLQSMFTNSNGDYVRYAGACRDISVQLPQDIVALHSAVATSFLKSNMDAANASIDVWFYDEITQQMLHKSIVPSKVHVIQASGWEVHVTKSVILRMAKYRKKKLPNETGGVLIGSFDMVSKIIHVVEVLPSPPDSLEWPTVYKRGHKGLNEQMGAIHRQAGGNLGYVGEWHSHTVGVSVDPSSLDEQALDWLADEMRQTGHPGLILIKGDAPVPNVILKE